jgi:hypothetical protein
VSDDATRKVVLPLAHNEKGDFRGLVLDKSGIRATEFTRIPDGAPIMGEFVAISPREGSPLLDAEYVKASGTPQRRAGPAMVASDAYREGYDRIFGKRDVGEA